MKVANFSGILHARRRFRIWSESRQQYVTPESLSAVHLQEIIRQFYSDHFKEMSLGQWIHLAWTNGTTARHRRYRVDAPWVRGAAYANPLSAGTPTGDLEIHGRWEYRRQAANGAWDETIITTLAMAILLQQQKVPEKTIDHMLVVARHHGLKDLAQENEEWQGPGERTAGTVDLSPRRTWWQWLLGGWFFRHLRA